MTGRFNPSPRRQVAAAETLIQAIQRSLLAQLGSGFVEAGPYLQLETLAEARAISEVYRTYERVANANDPARMSGVVLDRWCRILGINTLPEDSEPRKRRLVGAKLAIAGREPTIGNVYTVCSETLGSEVFVSVDYNDPGDGYLGAELSYLPGGLTLPLGVGQLIGDARQHSHLHHIRVMVTKPSYMTPLEFHTRRDDLYRLMRPWLPGYTNFETVQTLGFHLDQSNLDVAGLTNS
jgi:hypothetical protein